MENTYPWHRYRVAQTLLRLTPEERQLLRGMTHYLDLMQAIHDITNQKGGDSESKLVKTNGEA